MPVAAQRRLESRSGGRGVKGWQGLSDGALGCRCYGCHSRYAGMACFNHWIPACAGMTVGAEGKAFGRHGRGAVGMATNPLLLPSSFMDRKSCMRREGRMPVAAQRRLESRKGGRRVKGDRVYRMARSVVIPLIVIPAVRVWLVSTTGFLGLRSRRGSTTCIHAGGPAPE